MGNSKSGALSKELLEDLKLNTRYSEQELCRWYESFRKQCPDGRISRAEFERIYGNFFPNSDPQVYARHVFRSFDTNGDGTLDFREYIIALHLTSSGKTHLKLEWAFALFDVDRNGEVSKSEVLEIVSVSRGRRAAPRGGMRLCACCSVHTHAAPCRHMHTHMALCTHTWLHIEAHAERTRM
nr:PREDICTED: visinin-like [Apteryx mantelli mantelli]